GNFGELGGMPRLYFGRVNPDGSLDEAFIPELDEVVQVVSVQPGGKILIGGRFSTLDGESRTHLARLLPDGTVDPDFRVDANAWVSSLAMQADGKILVGGRFTDLGGQKRNYLARLHANGILDSTFDPSPDGPVHALLVQEDGKILVGGSFYHMAGRNCSQMARLLNTDPAAQSLTHNGSSLVWERGGSSPQLSWTTFDLTTDGTEWSSLGSGTWIGNGWHLMNLLLPSNGTILAQGGILGGFDNASGYLAQAYYGAPLLLVQPSSRTNDANTTATFVVTPQGTEPFQFQWSKEGMPLQDTGNTVGSRTSSLVLSNVSLADVGSYRALIYNEFGTITSAEATLTVLDPAIAVHPASQTGHAGQGVGFTVTAAGTPPFSYRWWKDGSPLAEATESSLILENVQTSDAGEYQVVIENIHGTVTSVIASLTVNLATLDSDFNPGPNDSVFALAMQADGKILVGGHYSNMGGQARGNISRLYAEGAIDPDYNPSASSDVTTMAVQEDGKVLVGGRFTTLGGQPRRYIGRLNADGTLDPDFNPGADRYVYALALQPDGKILVGGGFRELAEESRSFLGRLNPDGTLDPGFDPGANQAIGCLAVQPDGKILVGGDFYYIGGKNLNRLARLNADGTVDDGFNAHADNWVSSLVVQADGKILVGGGFSTLCGQPRSYLGRLNSDGTLDNSFTTGVEEDDPTRITTVYSLALQTDGKILVGGYFNRLGGQPRYHIGRLYSDGTVDSEFDPIAGSAISAVYGLGLQSDGKILVGGSFSTLAGQPIGDLGRLYNTEPATQSLSVNGAILTWLRGGTSPEAWRTTLEISAPGGDWNLIGPGSRVLGGWQWNNVSVPANSTFRARGYVAGGQSNVSSWFVETLWEPVMETRAVLSVESVNGSVIRFGLTGQIQAQYTIETSPAVSPAPAWTPFLTLTLTNGLGWFDWTNAGDGQRFFRAVEE
ncbi:MAG: immunoglobulin domain-containing protein, partial [Verrucomicrobiales bacterium]|nr:immunoglobulin domain-containing protein [Verrucomicrobiales bacterium]